MQTWSPSLTESGRLYLALNKYGSPTDQYRKGCYPYYDTDLISEKKKMVLSWEKMNLMIKDFHYQVADTTVED